MSRYSDVVREHGTNPRNVGEIPGAPVGHAGTPGQGPFVCLWLRVEGDTVTDARFKTYGCPSAIASGSVLTEMVKGRAVDGCAAIDAGQLLDALGGLPLGKGPCADLAVAALHDALSKVNGHAPGRAAVSTGDREQANRDDDTG